MKSELADQARHGLLEDLRRMTPEERLAAYARHCQLIAQLRMAGRSANWPILKQHKPDAY